MQYFRGYEIITNVILYGFTFHLTYVMRYAYLSYYTIC